MSFPLMFIRDQEYNVSTHSWCLVNCRGKTWAITVSPATSRYYHQQLQAPQSHLITYTYGLTAWGGEMCTLLCVLVFLFQYPTKYSSVVAWTLHYVCLYKEWSEYERDGNVTSKLFTFTFCMTSEHYGKLLFFQFPCVIAAFLLYNDIYRQFRK